MVLGSANATVGGTDPQDSNVIGGNGVQGVLIEPGASGNQVLGNQIGVVGPSSNGFYFPAGNGAEGVLIESSGTAAQSVEHRLCVEQHHRRRRRGCGQSHLGEPRATASTSRAWVRRGTWSRPTTSARRPAADIVFGNGQPGQPGRRRVDR